MGRRTSKRSARGSATVSLMSLLLVASCAHQLEARRIASSNGSHNSRRLGPSLRLFFDREVLLPGERPGIWVAFDQPVPPGSARSELLAGRYEISIEIRDPDGRSVASACRPGNELPHPDPAQVTAVWTLKPDCYTFDRPGVYRLRARLVEAGSAGRHAATHESAEALIRVAHDKLMDAPPGWSPVPSAMLSAGEFTGCWSMAPGYAAQVEDAAVTLDATMPPRPGQAGSATQGAAAALPPAVTRAINERIKKDPDAEVYVHCTLGHAGIRVQPVEDGWLVGFNGGEWGGGLWWIDRDGAAAQLIRSPGDWMQNVRGIETDGTSVYIFQGEGDAGGISRVARHGKDWRAEVVAELDGRPLEWDRLPEGGWLVLTPWVLAQVDFTGKQTAWAHFAAFWPPPISLTRSLDGTIWLGAKSGVYRLRPRWEGAPRYETTFLVPADSEWARAASTGSPCVPVEPPVNKSGIER